MSVPAVSMLLWESSEGFPQGTTHWEVAMSQVWPGEQMVWLQPQRARARTAVVSVLGSQAAIQRPESGLEVRQDFPASHRTEEPHWHPSGGVTVVLLHLRPILQRAFREKHYLYLTLYKYLSNIKHI